MNIKAFIITSLSALVLLSCADKPYVIVQIADAQLGFTAAEKSQREGTPYINDLSYESDCLRKAVVKINEMKPDAVVFTGDQVNDAGNQQQWDTFAAIIAGLDEEVRVFHLPGNHDVTISGSDVDSSPFTSRYGDDCFLHIDRGVRIVGINTNLIQADSPSEGRQMAWLKNVLRKESADEVTLIFGHHPFFLESIDEPDSYFPVRKDKRKLYFDVFAELDVDAVYAGHRHCDFEGEYAGIPMKTTTSVAFQIGGSVPSVRVITVYKDGVRDSLLSL